MKTLKIGIVTLPELKARILAIASGAYKPGSADPKLWFTSLEGLAKILSEPNRRLLDVLIRKQPGSLAELAKLSGRAISNLSRTIATMERYGLVSTCKNKAGKIVIRVPYQSIMVDVPIVSRLTIEQRPVLVPARPQLGRKAAAERAVQQQITRTRRRQAALNGRSNQRPLRR